MFRIADGSSLDEYKKITPILIGIIAGIIIIIDPWVVNYSNFVYLKKIPYLITVVCFLGAILLFLAYRYYDKVIENISYIVLAGIIIGDQMKGVTRGFNIADITLIVALLLWLIKHFVYNQDTFEITGLHMIAMALLTAIMLSMVNSGMSSATLFIKSLRNFCGLFIITQTITDKGKCKFFIKILLIVTTLSAAIGIFQEIFYRHTGMIVPKPHHVSLAVLLEKTSHYGSMLRVPALVSSQQDFANILGIALGIGLTLLLFPDTGIFKRKIYLAVSLLLMSLALVLTFTKGVWLAFMLLAYTVLYFRKPAYGLHLVLLSASLSVVGYYAGAFNKLSHYISSQLSHKTDISERLGMISETMQNIFAQHPLLGRGIGKSPLLLANVYGWPPHNTFAQALCDVGILGLSIYVSLYVYILVKYYFIFINAEKGEDKILITSLVMGFLSWLIYSHFSPFFMQFSTWMYIGVMGSGIMIFSKKPASG